MRLIIMKTRMVFLGGYLGAGKTTLAYHLAKALAKKELTVSVVMNDQGNVLVDTQFMKNAGVDVREVTGACFCTKFDEFVKHARSLVNIGHEDVIIAEPIGTSTSILASVISPLRSVYANEFSVAPLFVVVDSRRFLNERKDFEGPGLVQKHLIPLQQLHEAEIVVLSKQDLLTPEEKVQVKQAIQEMMPEAEILEFSSMDLTNLDKLVEIVLSERTTNRDAPKVDQRIFSGEKAALGWYSTDIRVTSNGGRLDSYDLIMSLMKGISQEFEPENIAHVKVLVSSPQVSAKISLVEDSIQVDGVKGGRFINGEAEIVLNARVIAPPDKLKSGIEKVVEKELDRANIKVVNRETACFIPRPDKPQHSMIKL